MHFNGISHLLAINCMKGNCLADVPGCMRANTSISVPLTRNLCVLFPPNSVDNGDLMAMLSASGMSLFALGFFVSAFPFYPSVLDRQAYSRRPVSPIQGLFICSTNWTKQVHQCYFQHSSQRVIITLRINQ